MVSSDIISAITLGAVVLGGIVNISSMVGKRETKAASDARVEVKLDNIYTKVDSMEKKQFNIEAIIQQHGDRITKVEESAKSLHHRMDDHERRDESK